MIHKRIVTRKSDRLPQALRKAFDDTLHWKWFLKPKKNVEFVMGHYRFGTSSAPAESETHPHIWMPERKASLWKIQGGQLVLLPANLATTIAHNGDFDEWVIFGK